MCVFYTGGTVNGGGFVFALSGSESNIKDRKGLDLLIIMVDEGKMEM